MENVAITLLIRDFNILSTTVMAFFAVYGAIAVFAKNSHLNLFRRSVFIQAFCVAALFAFVLEATVSNFPHYLKYFADGEFHTLEVSPRDSTKILTSDGTLAEIFFERADSASRDSAAAAASKASDGVLTKTSSVKNGGAAPDSAFVSASGGVSADTSFRGMGGKGSVGGKDTSEVWGGMVFKNLDRRVTSVFIEPVFDTTEWITAIVTITTKELGKSNAVRTIFKGMPDTYHIQFQPCGKVSELKVVLHGGKGTGASRIAINRQIPLYFSGLRLFVVSLLFFAVILFVYKPLRVRAAYLLFDYRFDPLSGKQNVVYILAVVSLILFAWVCAYTSVIEDRPQARQYNEYLVDAVLAGRTHLEAGNPEKLLKAPNPYDLQWLDENKYERGVDWMPDWVYYKGKFYCYFGVVPALILYVPYTLITEDYLSNHAGIFIFAAISIILLARLWRFFVKKYMPDARFAFYLLSFLTLFFATGWFCPLRFTRFYSIVSSAGFMFVIAGVLLLFESVEHEEKPDRSKLFFACACFALAVGCRPHLLFASLIVPVILWRRNLWKHLPLVAVPYIVAAIPMCAYNYVRFGSILEFGLNYNMTNLNVAAHGLLNPIGKLINTFHASLSYLFTLNKYSFFYPYVESIPQHGEFFWSVTKFYDKGCGMINFPIVFCLFLFFKNIFRRENRPKTFYISSAFLTIAAVLVLVNSKMIGHSGRYMIDFAVFIILPSLFCAYYWCCGSGVNVIQPVENQIPIRVRQKIVYVLLAFSAFVGMFLFATSVTNDATPYNPVLFRYMQQSLIIFGIV